MAPAVTLRTNMSNSAEPEGVVGILAGVNAAKRGYYDLRFEKELGTWQKQDGRHRKALYYPNLDAAMYPLLFWGKSKGWDPWNPEKLKRKCFVRQVSARVFESGGWTKLARVKQEWMCVHALIGDDIRVEQAAKFASKPWLCQKTQKWRSRLPKAFPGSQLLIEELRSKGLHITRQRGSPCWFLTVTASADWEELKELGITDIYEDPDMVCRVFMVRWEKLKALILDGKLFGRCSFLLGAVEFQFRGTIHGHLLIGAPDGPRNLEEIDEYVTASFVGVGEADKVR